MSRFKRAVAFLARETGAPLFVRMREERRALPMAEGIAKQLTPLVPHEKRVQVRSMVFMLNHSRRYLEACIADGAVRFNADGTAAGPVSERERRIAEQRRAAQAAEAERKARAGDQSTREAVPTVGGVHADSQFELPGPIPAKAGHTPGDVSRTLNLAGRCVSDGARSICGGGTEFCEKTCDTDGNQAANREPSAVAVSSLLHGATEPWRERQCPTLPGYGRTNPGRGTTS